MGLNLYRRQGRCNAYHLLIAVVIGFGVALQVVTLDGDIKTRDTLTGILRKLPAPTLDGIEEASEREPNTSRRKSIGVAE